MPSRLAVRPLAGLFLAMLLPSLGTSIANAGLPAFADAFGAHVQDVQWIVLAYLLAMTALVVGAGRLGDLIGRRRLLLGGIAVFATGSALAAAAGSLWLLVAARAAQGTGAAVMIALTTAMAGDIVPKERTGRAMGLLGTASAVGTALGPSLGGMLTGGFGWRAMFVLLAVMGAAALALVLTFPPTRNASESGAASFDALGTILLAIALGLYSLSMTIGRGAFGLGNMAMLGAAGVVLTLFAIVQTRIRSPLIELRWLRGPHMPAALVSTALVATVMMTTLVVGPFFLSGVLALSPAAIGLTMSVGPIMAALAGAPAGRLVDRFGPGAVALVGLAAMVAGCLALALTATSTSVAGYAVTIGITATGYALFQAANTTAILRDAPPAQRGVISGLLSLARNLGLITGAAAMGALFAVASHSGAGATPDTLATATALTFAAAAGLAALASALVMLSTTRHAGA